MFIKNCALQCLRLASQCLCCNELLHVSILYFTQPFFVVANLKKEYASHICTNFAKIRNLLSSISCFKYSASKIEIAVFSDCLIMFSIVLAQYFWEKMQSKITRIFIFQYSAIAKPAPVLFLKKRRPHRSRLIAQLCF